MGCEGMQMTKLKQEFMVNHDGKNWVILDDFMALKEKLKKTQKEYAKARNQLKEANEVIDNFRTYDFTVNDEVAEEYQVKWGVKAKKAL